MELNNLIDNFKENIVSSVQDIVKIKSVEGESRPDAPFGEGPAAVLKHALALAEDLGFKAVNLENYVGYAEYGDGEQYIAVLGHLDVVPEESGWQYPPYKAEIHDGKIYGRGTVDDKGPTIAALYALKAIKDAKLPINKRIRIIFGTNEETGCEDMQYYVTKEKPPVFGFTPDGDYPVIKGEKGNLKLYLNKKLTKPHKLISLKAGERLNIVPDYCEATIKEISIDEIINAINNLNLNGVKKPTAEEVEQGVCIKCFGKAAHGSTPELGVNAITQIIAILGKLDLGSSELNSLIEFYNKYINYETDGSSLNIALEDKPSGKLSLNVGKLRLEEDALSFGIDIRYPVTYFFEDVVEPLSKLAKDNDIEIIISDSANPLYFPDDHPLIAILKNVFIEQTGLQMEPKTIGGGTYAKYLPNTVAYGTIMPGKPHLEHQANEYIEIDDLIRSAKIYAHAMYELAK